MVLTSLTKFSEQPHCLPLLLFKDYAYASNGRACVCVVLVPWYLGMVDEDQDYTVVESCLREMYEELGIPPNKTEILGVRGIQL